MSIKAVRWLSFTSNPLVEPKRFTVEESLHFEMNPHREVSVEVISAKGSYSRTAQRIGLVLDIQATPLVIAYYEDGWTKINEEGLLRSDCYSLENCTRGEEIAFCWEEAEQMLEANPEREQWSEGIVANPIYTHVACFEESKQEALPLAQRLGLEIKIVQQAEWLRES